jgi:hypothetical protein
MKSVLRLLWTYFCGAPTQRCATALGLMLAASGLVLMVCFPEYIFSAATQLSIWWIVPLFGVMSLFLGGSLMPTVFARLALGHSIHTLPHGRLKLLTSALATVSLVSVVFALITYVMFALLPLDHESVFLKALVVSFLSFSVMYLVLWCVSRARSAIVLLGGAMLVIASLALPLLFISIPATSLLRPAIIGFAICGALIALYASAPRLRHRLAGGATFLPKRSFVSRTSPVRPGTQVDWLMGTARPWILAGGQLLPILVATRFIGSPNAWVFYFALFAVISGATTSLAATRSRSLWLRIGCSRCELFGRVEKSFWIHHCYSLGVLLLLLVGIGSYLNFSASLLALGMPLLILAMAISTYLGLMMTRELGWLDCCVAVAAVLSIMATAIAAADPTVDVSLVICSEALLAALGLFFRAVARRRWSDLDWMQCHRDVA